jgi:hypothetical protein
MGALPAGYKFLPSNDFITHQNYLEFLSVVSKGLTCKLNKTYTTKLKGNGVLKCKLGLIDLTLENVKAEIEMAHINSSYARLLAIWLPVKGYYAAFHLLCLACYLETANESLLNNSHLGSIKLFTQLIKNKDVIFNQSYFNWTFTGQVLNKLPITSGANLKKLTGNHDERCIQILKMIQRYKIEDLSRRTRGGLRSKAAKKAKSILENSDINIFEILYWYRIRANYKDLDIIEENLQDDYYLAYIDYYNTFLVNFISSLKVLVTTQAYQRGLDSQIKF